MVGLNGSQRDIIFSLFESILFSIHQAGVQKTGGIRCSGGCVGIPAVDCNRRSIYGTVLGCNSDCIWRDRFESHINRVIRSQIIKYIAGSVTGNRDSGTIYSESIYNVMLIRSKIDRQRFMLFPGWWGIDGSVGSWGRDGIDRYFFENSLYCAIFLQICECIGKRILADIHSFAVNQKRLQAMIGIASVGDGIGTAFIDFQIAVRDFSVFRTGCNTMDQWKGGFVQTEASGTDDGGSHEKMSGL